MKRFTTILLAALCTGSSLQADVIRQWDFNTIQSDFVAGTGTRRPNNGTGAPARTAGGVGDRFGTVSTVNQPDDPNTLDNTHWRIGQAENVATGAPDPGTGFPPATTGNKSAGVIFPVNSSGYSNIRVTWSQENSASASRYWRVQYTLNGADWLDTPTVITALSADSSGTESGTPIWQHGLSADFSGIAGANNNPGFAFRLVSEFESSATGAGTNAYVANRVGTSYGRAGTLWLDMVTVTGDSTDPANQWPTISALADQVILSGESTAALALTVSDAETAAQDLVVTAISSDSSLIASVQVSGGGGSHTVQASSVPGATGRASITVRAQDAGGKVTESAFEAVVTEPRITAIATQVTTSDAPVTVPVITTNLPGDPATEWTITGGSSNPSVIDPSGLAFGLSAVSNYLTITPVAGAIGNAVITITNSGARGWQAVQSFEVKVLPPKVVFFDLTGLPSSGGVASVNATTVSNGITAGALVRGPGIAQAGLGNGFSANQWNNTNSTTHPVVTTRASAMAEGDYFQFAVTVETGFTLSIASIETSLRRSAVAAPMNYEWQYSLDGFVSAGITLTNFTYFGRDSGTAPATLVPYQWMTTDTPGQGSGNATWPFLLDGLAPLQDLPPGTTITFRLYGWGNGAGADSNTVALGRTNGPAIRGIITAVAQAPAVAIRRAGSDVIVSWPASASGYQLQGTSSLTSPDWQPVGTSPAIEGDDYVVVLNGPVGTQFLRLAR